MQGHFGPDQVKVCISKLFIQCDAGNCCVDITSGVIRYSYVWISLLVRVCDVCVCVFVCVCNFKSQS